MTVSRGVSAFTEGFEICRSGKLLHYIWLPAAISLLVISTGLYFAFDYLTGLAEALTDRLPDWLSFIEALLVPLAYLIGMLIGAWLFAFLAVLISSPFLGTFSAAVERHRYGNGPDPDGSWAWWRELIDAFAREGRKLLYHLPRLLVVAILTLIPVINLAAPAIWLVFGAWTMAVQFVDYPLENRRQPFNQTLDLLRANRPAALAFGACVTAALAIPLLNFLLVPVAVAGGTLLFREIVPAVGLEFSRNDAR